LKDVSQSDWFKKDNDDIKDMKDIKDIKENIIEFKKRKCGNNREIVKINSVGLFKSSYGSSLYEKENEYFTSNSNSTLKYDDIRRVHRDETVFNVDESTDFEEQTVEELMKVRINQNILSTNFNDDYDIEEEKMLKLIEIKKLEYESNIKSNLNYEKGIKMISNFLRLS
jgi:hypothetical protein